MRLLGISSRMGSVRVWPSSRTRRISSVWFCGLVSIPREHTLPYGAIIGKTLSEVESWSVLPELDEIWPTWRRSAEEVHSGQYREHWQMAVAEMRQLLTWCQDAMTQGALSIDQRVLTQLGCFDRKVNGAGTIAAAASIFLASRYATDPFHGLMEAAFAYGADTDTIASMTGGLLGAVVGLEWLGDYAVQVQDAQYLRMLGERLAESKGNKQKIVTTEPGMSAQEGFLRRRSGEQ